jgi:hypothetical protein
MTENMKPRNKARSGPVPAEETLFSDKFISEVASINNTTEETVLRTLGIEVPIVTSEPVSGAYVTLEDRAIAVRGIIDGINRRNRSIGANIQADIENSPFRKRFRDPKGVASMMSLTSENSNKNREAQLDLLNATQAMISVGFDSNEVLLSKKRLREEISGYEGTGSKHSNSRKKLLKKVQAGIGSTESN